VAPKVAAVTFVVAAALALVGGAAAAQLTLTLGTAPSFGVNLDGTDQSVPFSFTMTVTGGGSAGWNISAAATAFTAGGHSLGFPTVTGVPNSACSGSHCVDPTNGTTYPVALVASAVKIYSAAAATGQGTIPLTANLTLSVPGNAFAGAYTSTLTLAIASGP
jgi:hypothetical protein